MVSPDTIRTVIGVIGESSVLSLHIYAYMIGVHAHQKLMVPLVDGSCGVLV
jgi:hypothetical protein